MSEPLAETIEIIVAQPRREVEVSSIYLGRDVSSTCCGLRSFQNSSIITLTVLNSLQIIVCWFRSLSFSTTMNKISATARKSGRSGNKLEPSSSSGKKIPPSSKLNYTPVGETVKKSVKQHEKADRKRYEESKRRREQERKNPPKKPAPGPYDFGDIDPNELCDSDDDDD